MRWVISIVVALASAAAYLIFTRHWFKYDLEQGDMSEREVLLARTVIGCCAGLVAAALSLFGAAIGRAFINSSTHS